VGKRLIRAAAAALLLSVASLGAEAAGLGRLTVLSSLGQPFRGEIDLVSVKKEEISSLTARMASPDAFRQADLPFTAYVSNLKLSLEKRPNGDPYVKITAAQPLAEPFIDFLVELGWTSGRLVRAYTALLDPPIIGDDASDTKVQAAPVQSVVKPDGARPAEPAPAKPAEQAVETRARPEQPPIQPVPEAAPSTVPAPAAESTAPAAPAANAAQPTSADYKTKRGDTLGKIARANKPSDLSLEQMLVLLYRTNPDAFDGKNMNRLRAGRVLRMPDATEAAGLAPDEARKEVRVQAANWNAYREKLAAMTAAAPADDLAPGPSAGGKITTKLDEKTPASAEPAKEVLKLSKGEGPGAAATGMPDKDGKSQQRIRTLEEEVAAKGKAVADASERIGQLEKQIKDMQALVEMKSKSVADLKVAPSPAPVSPPVSQPPASPPPVSPPPNAAAPTPAPSTPEPAAKATPPGEVPSLLPPKSDPAPPPAEPVAATPPAEPAEAQPAPPPRKPFVPTPPPPPPSLVDTVMGEPLYLAGGAAAIVALAGLGFMSWKRRRNAGAEAAATDSGTAAAVPPAMPEDLEATQPVTADGSDPLAEAEVFLIYGRDAQAEERLLEAIAATPTRYELHAKLLEIYAKRGDPVAFENVAKDLQMGTNAEGELWEKAAKLGYQIDPGNPRYASGRPDEDDTQRTFPGAESTLQMSAFPSGDAGSNDLDFNLGFDEMPSGNSSTDIDLGELGEELAGNSPTSTDIDLSDLTDSGSGASDILDPSKTIITSADEILPTTQMEAFDPTASLGAPDTGDLPTLPGIPAGSAAAAADDLGLDFDLGDATAEAGDDSISGGSNDIDGISFDLSTLQLDSPPLEDEPAPAAGDAAPELDLSGISLELGESDAPAESPVVRDEKWYDVQTKFDLAKAYQEMGDREGAREILDEVIAEGDPGQREAAEALMGTLQ
jgi:pilus assembly protein FimV